MRNDRLNYVLVGAFVIAMVTGLVISVAMLTGRTGATDVYYTRYDDATGIKYGTRVLYMGYPVGQVEEVRPVFENGALSFELELSIIQDFARWNVPANSVAQIQASGLLSALTVDIRAGDSKEVLAPGDRIEGVGRSDVFGAVSDTANVMRNLVINDVKPLLENLNHYVATVGGALEQRAPPLLENLTTLSEHLASRAPELIQDFIATSGEIRAVSRRLERTLSEENADKIGGVVDNVLAASEDLARLAGSARGQIDAILTEELTEQVRRIAANVDTAAADFAATSSAARAGVGSVLAEENLGRLDRTLANVESASTGARDLFGPERLARVDSVLESSDRATENLDGLIADVRDQVRGLLNERTVEQFNAALANVTTAAANIARLSDNLDRRVGDVVTPEMADRMRRALEDFSLAAASVASLTRGLDESREDLDAMLRALRGIAEENRASVRSSLEDLRRSLDVVARHIDAVAQNLEGSSRNMLEFSRRLKGNPGLLLRATPPAPDEGSGG